MSNTQEISLFQQIEIATNYIRSLGYDTSPDVGLIFGSGLSAIAGGMEVEKAIPYAEIPGFVETTLDFHLGRLLLGKVADKPVVAMDGRFHYYEGWSMQEIAFPVRVMKKLGISKLLISNIAGGLNPEFRAGDIVIIVDHINLMGTNPLIGVNDERLGTRFPDMAEPYSRRLIKLMEKCALARGIRLPRAVYAGLPGPMFETRAEYRMLRILGADMVGMSTVPEVITAVHSDIEVLALSLNSDECFPDCLEPLDVELLLERARIGGETIGRLFQDIISEKDLMTSIVSNGS